MQRILNKAVLKGHKPDDIVGAWELLARALNFDPALIGPGAKIEWAKKISPHLDLDDPCSPSLRKLIEGVQKIVSGR
jgi:hypothetical protein